MSNKINEVVTPEFRVSFPKVFKPESFQGGDPTYSVVMMFDKKQDIKALKQLAKQAVETKWPDPNKRPKNLRNPFRDGDVEKPDLETFAGKVFITASSKNKPNVVDQNVQPILVEDEFYGGCYARASVNAFAYDTAGNRGVSFGLNNIQKLREGEPFTGRSKPEDVFGPVESDSNNNQEENADDWM